MNNIVGQKEVDLEKLYQAVNRLNALIDQYDRMDQSYAQIEMENEVLYRIPNNKRKPEIVNQVKEQLEVAETHKDAITRAIYDITSIDVGDLRQRVTDFKLALQRYSEIEIEYLKTKQAFEILATSNGFDTEAGEGGSRIEFERELTNLKQNKEFVISYLRNAVLNCLNTKALVGASDSVLSPLTRSKEKELIS